MTHLFRLAGAAGLLLAVVGPTALPQTSTATAAAEVCDRGVTADDGGGWVALNPRFPAGAPGVTLVAAPAFAPDVIYATNGAAVVRTLDGGCTWRAVYTASAQAGVAEITALAAPSSATNSNYLYVGVTTTLVGGITRPSVAVSTRRGESGSWVVAEPTSALPPVGKITGVTASPQLPASGFAVVELDASAARRSLVYASSDAGATWERRTAPYDEFTGSQLVAHPTRQVELFALDKRQVVHSGDGGTTFSSASPGGPVSGFAAAPGAGGVRLAAARADRAAYARSDDGGLTWENRKTTVDVSDLAMAPLQDLVGFSAGTDFYLHSPRAGEVRRSPMGGAPSQLVLSSPTADGFAVTGVRGGSVLRLVLSDDLRVVPPTVGPGGVLTPVRIRVGGTKQFPSLLAPAQLRVSLPAGAKRVLPYRLLVPRTPTPVDAMFLVDTTGSMGGTINGLRQDIAKIVSALDDAGLDAQFGLGDFRDYPMERPDSSNWPYKLVREIGPAAGMKAALDTLEAGGGTDGPESTLAALLQSTTGEGHEGYIAPGQQARYRKHALKLAFAATDAEFHRAGDPNYGYDGRGYSLPWPGPEFETVMEAMRRAGVHQVGLAVSPNATDDLTKAARETETFAPDGGVDCNGDGLIDVKAEEPLVCDVSAGVNAGIVDVGGVGPPGQSGLTAAVVSLANGIPDLKAVTLRVSSGKRFARIAAGAPRRVLNLRADNDLDYGVQLSCPVAPPSRQLIELTASTSLRELASADIVLDCGGPPIAPLPVELPAAAAVAAAPAAAPAAAQPVPNPQPNPNPNPNPQANAAPNVNSGLVEQSETEAQLALAVGDVDALSSEAGEELAMSARTRPPEADLAFVAAAALLLSLATSVAVRNRSRPQACDQPR